MILYPAIDLKDGLCVRLLNGDMKKATIFNDDPAAQAQIFSRQGFKYLHIVDLDGAFAGQPKNSQAVERILMQLPGLFIQLGGGIRNLKTLENWLQKGISRIIIGTSAVQDPDFVREAAWRYPGKIAVGIDAKNGQVAIEGWAKTTKMSAIELGKRFEDVGVAAIIYTDISRDGAMTGLNIEATATLAQAVKIPVIASGGLASLADIEALLSPQGRCIAGAISGRALYDGRLNSVEALALITSKEQQVEGNA